MPLIEAKLRPVEVVLIARIERPPDDSPIMMNDVDWVQHEWEWGKETMLFELPSRPAQSWRIFYAQRAISPLATEVEPLGNLPGLAARRPNVLKIHEERYYLWHMEDDASFQKIRVSR